MRNINDQLINYTSPYVSL